MQSNEMTVNLEQRFLQSRESRVASLAASSTTTARHQELGRFWTELRQRLRTWTTRLEHVETRQELQDLQEELRTLRHHCLKPTLDFAVPTELPPADWRLLHAEFTKCATLWETVQIQRYPKGKFIFQRYRQEVGRRKALGIPLASEQSKKNSMELASRYHTHFSGNTGNDHDDDNNTSSSGPGPASLESVANAIICIQNDGTVQIQPNHGQDPYTISSAAVLLRNIQNCTIQMYVDNYGVVGPWRKVSVP